MIKILGADIATSSGLCFQTAGTPPSKWRALSIEADGENAEEKATDLALTARPLLESERPAFAAIEMPLRAVVMFNKKGAKDALGEQADRQTINPNALQLTGLVCGFVTLCDLLGIPWGLITSATWRSAYYGKGQKPADGDWKALALKIAHAQHVTLPGIKKADKDAAESIGIAVSWRKCTFVPTRHQRAFVTLCTGRLPQPENEVSYAQS